MVSDTPNNRLEGNVCEDETESPGDDRSLEKDADGCETTVCPPDPARLSMGNSKIAFISVLGSPQGPGTQLWPTEGEGHLQVNPPNHP